MKGVNAYRRTSVSTADPMDIVIALYDGLIRHLTAAQIAFSEGRRAEAGERIGKALAIVNELDASLDTKTGGEFSVQLSSLYAWFTQELLQTSVTKEPYRLAPVLQILSELREAWNTAATNLRASGATIAKAG